MAFVARLVDDGAQVDQIDPGAGMDLTGPIEAGRIDRVRKPMAAKQAASTGRPGILATKGQRRAGGIAARNDVFQEN